MAILNGIYNLLSSDTAFAGGLWGASFAFIFFLVGEEIKTIRKVMLDDRMEHIYLQTYFNDLHRTIVYDKKLLLRIIKDYENNNINIADFNMLPVRESAMTKINDSLFINRMSLHLADIKSLNASLENANKLKNKISENLNNASEKVEKDAKKSLENLIVQLKKLEKLFDFHLEMTKELAAENKLLIKKSVSSGPEINLGNNFLKRKKEIEIERISLEDNSKNSAVGIDYYDKVRKFGLEIDTEL